MRRGIEEHGDDFVFGATEVPASQGAGAHIDTDDPALTDWYEAAADQHEAVTAEDVARTLQPGHLQPQGPDRPDHTASGERALVAGTERRAHRTPES